ncbi:Elongator complex protein 2, partial [Pseudocercospora fuligena]
MVQTSLEYIAAGGNRHPSAADWASGLLAFGAGNNIALWNPDDEEHHGVTALLAGHTDAVNAVKFLDRGHQRLIISGSADMTVRIWAASDQTPNGYHAVQCLSEHTASINAIATLEGTSIFATGAADGTVKIWSLENATAELLQSISLKPRYFPLTLALTALSNGAVLLAVAGTSNSIQLYVSDQIGCEFALQATLSGHEGWIRSLDFTKERCDDSTDILLASASQDKYIRLWRLHQSQDGATIDDPETAGIARPAEKKSLSNKAHQVGSTEAKYNVTFEALLIGHEDWVYTARWSPTRDETGNPLLLSASADNSLSIWHADAGSGLWICSSRLGEISSQKGSTTATGSTGGFWIGLWRPSGQSVVSLGRTGSWRRWVWHSTNEMWLQQIGISGHVEEVRSLTWAPSGNYLLTTGSDQTTRSLSLWSRNDSSSWHETSRPQIHGYDLNCIATITENQFVSGADEKLLRVFNKPKAVDNLMARLGNFAPSIAADLPDAANIPVLGLSNKAVATVDDEDATAHLENGNAAEREAVDPSAVIHRSTLDLRQPPFEDHLARHTLWPEHEKLYGHGYEISTVATSHDGSLIATACKASAVDHAVIRLYETKDWREIKPPLLAHNLTVTSLAFSPDDKYLLSVSRDRQWAIFERGNESPGLYTLHATNPKGHSRMILDCDWLPPAAGSAFVTAGRDKSAKVWKLESGEAEC